MKISNHNALSFYKFMDDAATRLKYLGDRGQTYVARLREIRGTLERSDIGLEIGPGFFDAIDKLVDDMAEHLTERVMNPVGFGLPIPPARVELLPDAAAAIGYLTDARNWVRDHQE